MKVTFPMPEYDDSDSESDALGSGSWGYQVLYEKARKLKKNPLGFAVKDNKR